MRDYEAMLIFDPSLESEELEKKIKKFEQLITRNKGKITKIDRWGKRKFAYPIRHLDSGYYVIYYFNGEEDRIKEINRVMQISDEVIRHKIIRRDE